MKKILFISLLALFACSPREKKQYDFEIITTNGDTLETSFIGVGTNLFSLRNGDLTTNSFTKTLMSGVRSYKVISIKARGIETQAEYNANPSGNLKQITNVE